MPVFNIGRKTQYLILIDACGGSDTEARERRLRIAGAIQEIAGCRDFEPRDMYSYDLSLLLESLTDDQHADVFEALLQVFGNTH